MLSSFSFQWSLFYNYNACFHVAISLFSPKDLSSNKNTTFEKMSTLIKHCINISESFMCQLNNMEK